LTGLLLGQYEVVGERTPDVDAERARVVAGLRYRGGDATKELLLSTLLRLPEDVQTFAVTRCRFVVAADPADDETGDAEERHRVVLWDGMDDSDVLEGIARVWLGHDRTSDAPDDESRAELSDLVAQWQFTGPGGDA